MGWTQTFRIIFDGEYSNGERNGKGKEYNNNKLSFEGNYRNGKRDGKGVEYSIKFEGYYSNGQRITNNKIIFD